jgi:Bacterial extracellular solute-binding proteins, family 3
MAQAQPMPDPRVVDLVRSGRVRVALFLPQFSKDPLTGEIRRDVHLTETARALAARLGVELQFVEHPTPTRTLECLADGTCDVAFMGNEPSRAGQVSFSPPVFELDFTYLVPADSAIRRSADADRPGIRIAVVRDHVSTLALTRILKSAELVYANTPEPAFELLRTGRRPRSPPWASCSRRCLRR